MQERHGLVEKLLAGDHARSSGGDLSPEFLRSVVDFAASYAKLERLVFGNTRVLYSNAALSLDLSIDGDVMAQGEKLAEAERARFDLPPGPILELGYLIEDQGVKIIPRSYPAGSTARGGFFFDSKIGPCILLNAAGSRPEIDYTLAHQYGHFLADYEPYITTICGRPDPDAVLDPRELRAHQFALAFLMPRADIDLYRSAMGLLPNTPIPMDFVRQLQVYFDVDFEMVFWRLLSLGWIDPQQVRALVEANAGVLQELQDTARDPIPVELIPERYIHLVASAFGRNLIEIEDAAAFLGTGLDEAQHILDQFHYEEREGTAKRPAKKPAKTPSSGPPPPAMTPNPN